ncbi:MAG: hypothetical protein RIK87_12290 [Fuerstiella sp.]
MSRLLMRTAVQCWPLNCEQRNEYGQMIASQLPFLLAAGFGTGVGVGISTGLVTGLLFGAAAGASFATKKIGRQLTAAIGSGDISVVDTDDQPMNVESVIRVLNDKFDKA